MKNKNKEADQSVFDANDNSLSGLASKGYYKSRERVWLKKGDYKGLNKEVLSGILGVKGDPCAKFLIFSKAVSTLIDMHDSYTPRPCIPVIFSQHRSAIRSMRRRFQNEAERMKVFCNLKLTEQMSLGGK